MLERIVLNGIHHGSSHHVMPMANPTIRSASHFARYLYMNWMASSILLYNF